MGRGDVQGTLAFKYTVDYPRVELHPFDTKKLSLLYSDTADMQPSALDHFAVKPEDERFTMRLDMRTLSRESRDLICLVLKAFAAQSYFLNSKVISTVEDTTQCERTHKRDSFLTSDVLLELECSRHELNQVITESKAA